MHEVCRSPSTLSPPCPSHSSFISFTSSCTSSTTLRTVASLCIPPERVWTLLTTPTSSQPGPVLTVSVNHTVRRAQRVAARANGLTHNRMRRWFSDRSVSRYEKRWHNQRAAGADVTTHAKARSHVRRTTRLGPCGTMLALARFASPPKNLRIRAGRGGCFYFPYGTSWPRRLMTSQLHGP